MIGPTDEMVEAFRATPGTGPWSTGDRDDGIRAGLAAVLALVERDYRVEPRPPWDKAPYCPVVNDRCPGDANGWICAGPCTPDGTS